MYPDYYVDTSYGLNAATSTISGFMLAFVVIVSIIGIAISIISIVSLWRIFTKKGKPGWASLIPIYNIYIMCQIAGLSGIYVLLCFIPLVNIYALIMIFNGISKAFGKATGFTVGLILLPYVFMPILAFGKDSQTVEETATTSAQNTTDNTIPVTNESTSNEESMNLEKSAGYEAPTFGPTPAQENLNSVVQPNAVSQQASIMNPSFGKSLQNDNFNQNQFNNVSYQQPTQEVQSAPSFNNQNQMYGEPNSVGSNNQTFQNVPNGMNSFDASQNASPNLNTFDFNSAAQNVQAPPTNVAQPVNNPLENQISENVNTSSNAQAFNLNQQVETQPIINMQSEVEPQSQPVSSVAMNDVQKQNNNFTNFGTPQQTPNLSNNVPNFEQPILNQNTFQPSETLDMQEDLTQQNNQTNGNQNT